MRKILFIILTNTFLLSSLLAQNIHLIKSFSDEQFNIGNYNTALKEYQRVLLFDTEKLYNDIYSKIASIYFNQADYENAIRYFNFAWRAEKDDSLKFEIALKKVICNFKQDEYYAALNELLDLPEQNSEYFKDKKYLYLGISYFGLGDYTNSISSFSGLLDSVGIQQINRIFADFSKFRKKFKPEKVELMSMFLPGLGQIYVGDIGSGINSIILLSGITIYAIYTAVTYGFVDGALLLSSWFYRYYNGGSLKANGSAQNKIMKKKAKVYSEILRIIENHKNY